MTRAIVWDWNGTLLDDVSVCIDSINQMMARRGLPPVTLSRYCELFDFPVIRYYEALGFDFSAEDFSDVAAEYHLAYADRVDQAPLHTAAISALRRAGSAGVEQAILSALEESRLKQELRKRRIASYFRLVHGLNDLHARSKIERGRQLLDHLECRPDEVCMIGDTVHDAEVAEALAIHCVLVPFGHHGRARVVATGRPVAESLVQAVEMALSQEE